MDRLKLNLYAFNNAFIREFRGKSANKRCVCIPIEDNYGFEGAKGVYVEGIIRESNSEFSKGFVALSLPKSVYDNLSKEERNAASKIFAQIEAIPETNKKIPAVNVPLVDNDVDDLPF